MNLTSRSRKESSEEARDRAVKAEKRQDEMLERTANSVVLTDAARKQHSTGSAALVGCLKWFGKNTKIIARTISSYVLESREKDCKLPARKAGSLFTECVKAATFVAQADNKCRRLRHSFGPFLSLIGQTIRSCGEIFFRASPRH